MTRLEQLWSTHPWGHLPPSITRVVLATLVVSALVAPADVRAFGTEGLLTRGFVSQGYIHSLKSDFFGKTRRGSFHLTDVAVTFSASPEDRIQVGLQLAGHRFGDDGEAGVGIDWAYVAYHAADSLQVRAGRLKAPVGLYNEIADIDAARTSILLPTSLYAPTVRLVSHTGVGVFGTIEVGSLGDLDYQLVLGHAPAPVLGLVSFRSRMAYGGRVVATPAALGLRVAVSGQVVELAGNARINTEVVRQVLGVDALPEALLQRASFRFKRGVLAVLSAEYDANDLFVAVEARHMQMRATESFLPGEPRLKGVIQGAYAMASYRVCRWLHPGVYGSWLRVDQEGAGPLEPGEELTETTDAAVFVRFDLNDFWLFKAEAHYLNGGALEVLSDPDVRLDDIEPHWFVFLAKTTMIF